MWCAAFLKIFLLLCYSSQHSQLNGEFFSLFMIVTNEMWHLKAELLFLFVNIPTVSQWFHCIVSVFAGAFPMANVQFFSVLFCSAMRIYSLIVLFAFVIHTEQKKKAWLASQQQLKKQFVSLRSKLFACARAFHYLGMDRI